MIYATRWTVTEFICDVSYPLLDEGRRGRDVEASRIGYERQGGTTDCSWADVCLVDAGGVI